MMQDNKARRRYQQGSLRKDGARWMARWREDITLPAGVPLKRGDKVLSNGLILRRVRRSDVIASVKECPTKRLAQRKLDERLREINHEDYKPTTAITFRELAKKWQDKVMVHHKGSTQDSERSKIKVHLVPAFGDFELKDIRLEVIQDFVNRLQNDKLAPKTIRQIVAIMMVMWDTAQAWGYANHNPFPRGVNGRLLLKLPALVKGKAWSKNGGGWVDTYKFTMEETVAIIAKAEEPWQTFFLTEAQTGVRPGEIAGLPITGVGHRRVTITQNVYRGRIQTPKTQAGVRDFVIAEDLERRLRKVIADNEGKPNPHGLVFINESGNPVSIDNIRNRVLNPILKELGILDKLKALGVDGGNYAFRRMNGTVMDTLRVPLKTRQKRMGHSDPALTLSNYTAPLDQDDVAFAEQINELLSPKQEGYSVQ